MPAVTRNIGLSLGADICWPLAFEQILADSKLSLKLGKDVVNFACERVPLEPFALQKGCKYDVVVDRLTHWFKLQREWIKKGVLMDDLYVYNNPWSVQSYEKHTSYCAMLALGMPVPDTAMLPQKDYDESGDLEYTLSKYAQLFELGPIGEKLGYPSFLKPFDGGGWRGVSKVDSKDDLVKAYDESGKDLMHLQAAVDGFDVFVRAVGIGPQVRVMKYDPSQPLHQRYLVERDFVSDSERQLIVDTCLTINTFFGWDFNSCEMLSRNGVFHPIDFANPCPDNQVNSIHHHWPWYVISNLKWAVFNAATQRAMRKTVDFEPYYEIARTKKPFAAKLKGYAKLARERLAADEFAAFEKKHLGPLEQAAFAWFRSDRCVEAIRKKVAHVFPEHEVDEFTDRFRDQVRASTDELEAEAAAR
ncbi:MAG: RimK family alpha-L-glutamate ligase [Planctomycetota bacterium]